MFKKPKDLRLWYYIGSGMLSTFSGGIVTLDLTDWRGPALFAASIIGAGISAARAYVDQTISRTAAEQPKNNEKVYENNTGISNGGAGDGLLNSNDDSNKS